MKTVNFQKLSFQNFLSVGEQPLELDFTTGITIITGENLDNIGSRNGIGKCLDPSTEIDIMIEDSTVLEKFENIL